MVARNHEHVFRRTSPAGAAGLAQTRRAGQLRQVSGHDDVAETRRLHGLGQGVEDFYAVLVPAAYVPAQVAERTFVKPARESNAGRAVQVKVGDVNQSERAARCS